MTLLCCEVLARQEWLNDFAKDFHFQAVTSHNLLSLSFYALLNTVYTSVFAPSKGCVHSFGHAVQAFFTNVKTLSEVEMCILGTHVTRVNVSLTLYCSAFSTSTADYDQTYHSRASSVDFRSRNLVPLI